MSTRRIAKALGALLVLLLGAPRAHAHEGPPYPIFVDEEVGAYTVSIWADPDVGTATFYYYVECGEGLSPQDVRIELQSEPQDGGANPVACTSVAAEPGEPFQQVGLVDYPYRGIWHATFVVRDAVHDGAELRTLEIDLDVTPPGLGFFYFLWYAIPFVAIGFIWFRRLALQRAYDREAASVGDGDERAKA
ncbi:MAG: hypothetical protein R3F34_15885 [Planctomycetota bacterium]